MSLLSSTSKFRYRIGGPNWTRIVPRPSSHIAMVGYAIGFLVVWFYAWVLVVLLWHFGNDILAYDTNAIDNSIKYLGGILALPAALWTVYVAVQQILISRENQFATLFSNSIKQLGTPLASESAEQTPKAKSSSFDVRIAGIYGLERVARDSSRDHWPIMEILCRYVRQNHRAEKVDSGTTTSIDQLKSLPEPPFDLETAMIALGRRSRTKVALEVELRNESLRDIKARRLALNEQQAEEDDRAFDEIDESFRLKFDGSDLRKLKLWHCDFSHGLFQKCDMRGIVFWGCDLSDTKFSDSLLSGAIFFDCSLDRAIFSNNDLSHAQLSKVTLRGTRFYEPVNVSSTSVFDTDLEQVDKKLRPVWNKDWVFNF